MRLLKKLLFQRDDYPIIDTEVIEFISKEFPDTSKEIGNSLKLKKYIREIHTLY